MLVAHLAHIQPEVVVLLEQTVVQHLPVVTVVMAQTQTQLAVDTVEVEAVQQHLHQQLAVTAVTAVLVAVVEAVVALV